jgi:hypothetical protein
MVTAGTDAALGIGTFAMEIGFPDSQVQNRKRRAPRALGRLMDDRQEGPSE